MIPRGPTAATVFPFFAQRGSPRGAAEIPAAPSPPGEGRVINF